MDRGPRREPESAEISISPDKHEHAELGAISKDAVPAARIAYCTGAV